MRVTSGTIFQKDRSTKGASQSAIRAFCSAIRHLHWPFGIDLKTSRLAIPASQSVIQAFRSAIRASQSVIRVSVRTYRLADCHCRSHHWIKLAFGYVYPQDVMQQLSKFKGDRRPGRPPFVLIGHSVFLYKLTDWSILH